MFVVFESFEAWGLPKILKNELEFRCGLEVSVFQKKGDKREPPGKRGRGRAAGAAEDHTSIQHSLETIALQPFSFKRASRSFANTGSFFPFCGCLFSRAFSAGRQHEIFQFSCVFGSLGGRSFWCLFSFCTVFL